MVVRHRRIAIDGLEEPLVGKNKGIPMFPGFSGDSSRSEKRLRETPFREVSSSGNGLPGGATMGFFPSYACGSPWNPESFDGLGGFPSRGIPDQDALGND